MNRIRGEKDFGIGVIYFALGLVGFIVARNYNFGTAGRMGPGYFPTIISALLVVFGAVAIGKGLLRDGEAIGAVNWKGLSLITLSVCAFGFLLERAGLIVALTVLIVMSAAASERFRLGPRALIGLVALVIFCVAVFVGGLGLPMPLIGEWFR